MGLPEFLARYGGSPREEFESRVQVPHLIFPSQPEGRSRLPFLTTRKKGGKLRETIEDASAIGLYGLPTELGQLAAVGRSGGNELVIRSGEISKVHCFLRRTDGGWEVKDADSANGTCHNGTPLTPETWMELSDGDVLLIADFLEIHCLAPRALFSLLKSLRSEDAPPRDPPDRSRSRRFFAVLDEGPVREHVRQTVARYGEFHCSRLWSDLAPLIWSANPGDVVLCTPVMYGLRTDEFCRIVARHRADLEQILIGSDPSLPDAVTQLPLGMLKHELERRFGKKAEHR